MNGAQLEAAFDAHKVPILATAGAGVAVLAFMRRKSSASSAAAQPAMSSGAQLAGTAGAGGSAYDSTATDLAGYLGGIQSQLAGLQNALDTNTIPVPAPTPPVTPVTPPKPTPPKQVDHRYVPGDPKVFRQVPTPAPPRKHAVDQWVNVAKGQTLSGIAAKYGPSITPGTIAATNGIADPNKIYAGQRLHIVG